MTGEVHIYRAASQPLTRFVIDVGGLPRHTTRTNPRRTCWCHQCGRGQVYYDKLNIFCADGRKKGKRGTR